MSHKLAKDKGFKYVTLITACDNTPAQNLYNKLGYILHQTDGVKDFYYKKL
jgi:ribosomal protein S18 acetylase RimI-like enzyme